MTTQPKIKWHLEAEYYQSCNCDYGCPCEFEAPPTKGYCDGIAVWRINRGSYGNVSLDGLSLGGVLHSPGALHKGNMTLAVFVDEKATRHQREAILTIASGKAGGMPFEIFAQLVSKLLEPQFVSFEFAGRGKNKGVKIGNAALMTFEPVKNPVTGEPEKIRITHGTGFIFKSAEVVSAKVNRSNVPGLKFSNPDKAGFIARVKYAN